LFLSNQLKVLDQRPFLRSTLELRPFLTLFTRLWLKRDQRNFLKLKSENTSINKLVLSYLITMLSPIKKLIFNFNTRSIAKNITDIITERNILLPTTALLLLNLKTLLCSQLLQHKSMYQLMMLLQLVF